jgi:hypothetical protein
VVVGDEDTIGLSHGLRGNEPTGDRNVKESEFEE